jgi:hypothetical protein
MTKQITDIRNLEKVFIKANATLYENEMELNAWSDFLASYFVEKRVNEERINFLETKQMEKVIKKMTELKLKKIFTNDEEKMQKTIDQLLKYVLQTELKNIVKKIESEINYELRKLEQRINKSYKYFASDQFLIDKLIDDNELLINDEFKII